MKKNMTATTEQLIEKLTNAISFKFKDDPTSPGLTISKLRNGHYCSVVRYPKGGTGVKSKLVVCKAQGNNLSSTLKELANKFVAMSVQPKDPVQELGDLVGQ